MMSSFDLLDPSYLRSEDCHAAFARLRKEQPVFWYEGKEGGFWVITKHADVMTISSDPETFSSRSGVFIYDHPADSEGALLFTDPPEHRRLRHFVTGSFMGRGVSRLEPFLRSECQSLIQRALKKFRVDAIADLAVDLPLNTISEMMNLPPRDGQRLLALADELAAAGAAGGDRAGEAMSAMSNFGVEVARGRRVERGDDLVSAMLNATDSEGCPLTDREVGMMFMQIAGAATDTTRGVIGEILLRFARDTELYSALKQNPALVRGMIEEVLRICPPVYYMRRTATRDILVRDTQIRSGDRVLMYYLSANFDEEVFENPRSFDIRRRRNPHLSFGYGEHICLGLNVARLEIQIFVEELLKHVSRIELDGQVLQDWNTESTRYRSIPLLLS